MCVPKGVCRLRSADPWPDSCGSRIEGFEHTLIIVDEGAYLHFIEGCSAPKYNVANLHAGCVELYVGKNAKLRYSTIENWSKNMYNLNTKRAIVERVARSVGIGFLWFPCIISVPDEYF